MCIKLLYSLETNSCDSTMILILLWLFITEGEVFVRHAWMFVLLSSLWLTSSELTLNVWSMAKWKNKIFVRSDFFLPSNILYLSSYIIFISLYERLYKAWLNFLNLCLGFELPGLQIFLSAEATVNWRRIQSKMLLVKTLYLGSININFYEQ